MPSCFCTITKPFWLLLLVLFSTVGGIVLYLTRSPETSPYASVTEALSVNGIPENFARAETVRKFVFPEDAGPHPDFQTEWWYYTGNLDDGAGHHFGYQLTFFRRAVAAEAPKRPSRWGTRQVYFAHFAVTDVAENRFYSFERFSRGSTGLAGARARPYSVWLENWRAFDREGKTHLVAQEKNVSLKLTLSPQKPIALHGDRGLSPKSLGKGNASYYYSQTRIETTGRIKIGSNSHQVQGSSWLDREWSTSTLGRNQSGWDWFSIQL
ncbi:MAG: carotenoid 1,2-hydratase, partial [Proteobacteria bacterium]|nr:carotenoid 1,2-hydratase [Pseudomonadota bacterium]